MYSKLLVFVQNGVVSYSKSKLYGRWVDICWRTGSEAARNYYKLGPKRSKHIRVQNA